MCVSVGPDKAAPQQQPASDALVFLVVGDWGRQGNYNGHAVTIAPWQQAAPTRLV